jgi:hypothetical protein
LWDNPLVPCRTKSRVGFAHNWLANINDFIASGMNQKYNIEESAE